MIKPVGNNNNKPNQAAPKQNSSFAALQQLSGNVVPSAKTAFERHSKLNDLKNRYEGHMQHRNVQEGPAGDTVHVPFNKK